jgi:integrase
VHPALQAVLDVTPNEFLVTQRGRPYTRKALSEQFRVWCNAAGLPTRCVFHGLRKAGQTRLADAGCDPFEVAAWSGHKSLSEIERYTKAANRKRAALSGLRKSMANAVCQCQTL